MEVPCLELGRVVVWLRVWWVLCACCKLATPHPGPVSSAARALRVLIWPRLRARRPACALWPRLKE